MSLDFVSAPWDGARFRPALSEERYLKRKDAATKQALRELLAEQQLERRRRRLLYAVGTLAALGTAVLASAGWGLRHSQVKQV